MAVHVIKWSKTLPDPDQFKHSVVISVIIHGSALAVLNLLTYGLWVSIALCGNVAHQFLFKLTQWPISAGIVLPAIQKFPITVGFVLVSMAYGSCGGLALICAVLMYFILLSKMYEDYLEEYVFKTAAVITEKLFGKRRNTPPNIPSGSTSIPLSVLFPPKKPQEEKPPSDESSDDKKADETQKDTTESEKKEKLIKNEAKDTEKESQPLETEKESEKVATKEKKEKKKSKNQKEKKVEFATISDNDSEEPSTSTAPLIPKSKSDLDIKDGDEGTVVASSSQESFELLYNQLDPDDVAMFSKRDEPEEMTEEERKEVEKAEAGPYRTSINRLCQRINFINLLETDAELEKLITQMVERQKVEEDKRNEEMKVARAEYDEVPDGLSAIHFHMTLFLLLCVLALLNLPSVIVWARNYKYGEKILQHDPSYFPSIASIISLSVIWQLPTPRNV